MLSRTREQCVAFFWVVLSGRGRFGTQQHIMPCSYTAGFLIATLPCWYSTVFFKIERLLNVIKKHKCVFRKVLTLVKNKNSKLKYRTSSIRRSKLWLELGPLYVNISRNPKGRVNSGERRMPLSACGRPTFYTHQLISHWEYSISYHFFEESLRR